MSERLIDVAPALVRGRKRDGRRIYDRVAKREAVCHCQQSDVSVAAIALAHGRNANPLRKSIMMARGRRAPAQRMVAVLLPVRADRSRRPVSAH